MSWKSNIKIYAKKPDQKWGKKKTTTLFLAVPKNATANFFLQTISYYRPLYLFTNKY